MDHWWRAAEPAEADELELPRDAAARRKLALRLRDRDVDSVVALRVTDVASWLRARSFLGRAGMRLDREYVAVPGFGGPGFLVEARRDAIRHFFSAVLFLPAGGSLRVIAMTLLARVASSAAGWRLAAALAPARLVIARRT